MEFSIPHPDLNEFNALPSKVRDTVRRRLASFAQAAGFMQGGMSQAKALKAASSRAAGCSFGSLKRHFTPYLESGDWRILTDARFEKAPGTNHDFAAWARKLKGENQRSTGKSAAWREAIRRLVSGESIPSLGTWQEVWRRENPGRPLPDVCPYSEMPGSQPKRLSHRQFYRLAKTTKSRDALMGKGTAALHYQLSNLVEFDTSALRPMEWIAFDDVRTDFLVLDPVSGKVVELWLLVAMDVGTRRILTFGCRPKRERKDGTKEGLTRRDMQHLICGLLRRYGLPQGYSVTLLVENASAAITEAFEAALREASGGIVGVRRTAMLAGNPFRDGWGEKADGNPHGKAWIESAFNLMHNEAGSIIGQIGADYTLRSQGVEPAISHAQAFMKKAGNVLHLTERRAHGLPFECLYDARRDMEEIFVRMDNRRNHSLKDFDKVSEWRWRGQPTWNPWREYPAGLPPESRQQIETRRGPESPWMRWSRLAEGCKFIPLAASTLPSLMMDHQLVKYHGGGIVGWKIDGRMWRYDISDYRLPEGETLTAWFDGDFLEDGVWLTNGRGAFIGHAHRTLRMPVQEIDSATEAVKRKRKVFSKELAAMRTDHLTEAVLNQRMADADANLETLELARSLLPPDPQTPDADDTANPASEVTRAAGQRAAQAAKTALPANAFIRAGTGRDVNS